MLTVAIPAFGLLPTIALDKSKVAALPLMNTNAFGLSVNIPTLDPVLIDVLRLPCESAPTRAYLISFGPTTSVSMFHYIR